MRAVDHAIRSVFRCVLPASLIALSICVMGDPRPVQSQAGVVTTEDVTTPTPFAPLVPTPTPAPPVPADEAMTDGEELRYAAIDGSYVVREGDTLWTVALEIGMDLEAMPCVVNPHYRYDLPLVVGDRVVPPSGEMKCHEVQAGDTATSIGTEYGVDVQSVLADPWNELGGYRALDPLEPGRFVRVVHNSSSPSSEDFLTFLLERPIDEPPMVAYAMGGPERKGDQALIPPDWRYGSGYFEWPTYGWITQGYRNDHRALDIAAPAGAFVTAADRGEVIRAGWNEQGYGMFVVIDHNIDYVTLYSHLQNIVVREGDIVAQGDIIGTVGSTGNSTGPHLHFEVRDFGSRINPLQVLLR